MYAHLRMLHTHTQVNGIFKQNNLRYSIYKTTPVTAWRTPTSRPRTWRESARRHLEHVRQRDERPKWRPQKLSRARASQPDVQCDRVHMQANSWRHRARKRIGDAQAGAWYGYAQYINMCMACILLRD